MFGAPQGRTGGRGIDSSGLRAGLRLGGGMFMRLVKKINDNVSNTKDVEDSHKKQ